MDQILNVAEDSKYIDGSIVKGWVIKWKITLG